MKVPAASFFFCLFSLISWIVLLCDGFILVSGRLYQCGQVGGGNHDYVEERHRHRYEVNPDHVKQLEEAGMTFVGHSTDNTRMEIMELKTNGMHLMC